MKRPIRTLLAACALASSGVLTAAQEPASPLLARDTRPALAPEPIHGETLQAILERLGNHYRDIPVDDALSERMLEQYLSNLDPNRLHLLASDVAEFNRYRSTLDEALQEGDLTAGYQIYSRYHQRTRESLQYVIGLLKRGIDKLDLSDEETLQVDRSTAPWPKNRAEAQDLWRKRIEDAVLAMRLNGDSDEEIAERLTSRYESQLKRLDQRTAEDVFQIYVNALASIYDPHTSYFTPHNSENFTISMSRSLEGIGAELQAEEEYTKVMRLVPGGPAAKAGQLQPADRIVAVGQKDGEMVNIIGWRLDEVVNLIRGPKGSEVKLEVIPAGAGSDHKTRTITIVRDKVELKDQAAKKELLELEQDGKDYRIGVIEIPQFNLDFDAYHRGDPDYTSTSRDVERLLGELMDQDIDGLVIDLRNNGGGSLAEAIRLVSLFIDRGPTVQVRDARGRVEAELDQFPGMLYFGPMAVLVNRNSASASEIFAGAMQDYGRALIVGDQTFGKGTVQTLMRLDHGQLKITMAKFYRVSGGSNQNLGIVPDIRFPYLVNKEEIGESALPNALPWDQISPARFTPALNLSPMLEKLRGQHQKRIATHPEFDYIRGRIALMEEMQERTELPLKMAARKAQQADWENRRLAIENAVRKHRGLKPIADVDALHKLDEERLEARKRGEEVEEPDPYLSEAGSVLVDLIRLQQPETMISSAAQVQPN